MTNKFTKLSEQESEIIGGAGFAAIVPYIPVIISGIASLVGSFKALTSTNGEIKTKEGLVQKWDSPQQKETKVSSSPVYFIY
ncbi:hypothetical protein [Mesomycoplasma lagogenitalium]|uniref:Bacteriocin n=1 Tax=Mesomycoplasma lagogenitalium TaxID=171286 RepID=A0ABY8LSV8_9BACT|nr:hypothetical protein [Mesomycoplasma lagogenitalium]WGI36339.1 hypothetical protein QEG99_02570 [Mesomycoplasma lagogenitalium]